MNNADDPYDWWEVSFSSAQLVSTFFISMRENCCTERDFVNINVGNSTPPYSNPLCHEVSKSGWYTCYTRLKGTSFGLSRNDTKPTHFREIMAFS
jgi:hypothetical protein